MSEALEQRVRELEQTQAADKARWDEQLRWNVRIEGELQDMTTRMEQNFGMVFRKLTHLEVKVAGICAIASLAGGTVAHFLPW